MMNLFRKNYEFLVKEINEKKSKGEDTKKEKEEINMLKNWVISSIERIIVLLCPIGKSKILYELVKDTDASKYILKINDKVQPETEEECKKRLITNCIVSNKECYDSMHVTYSADKPRVTSISEDNRIKYVDLNKVTACTSSNNQLIAFI